MNTHWVPIESDRVKANRDSNTFNKDDEGTIRQVVIIDSEEYLIVDLDKGFTVGPSCINYWNQVITVSEKGQ